MQLDMCSLVVLKCSKIQSEADEKQACRHFAGPRTVPVQAVGEIGHLCPLGSPGTSEPEENDSRID